MLEKQTSLSEAQELCGPLTRLALASVFPHKMLCDPLEDVRAEAMRSLASNRMDLLLGNADDVLKYTTFASINDKSDRRKSTSADNAEFIGLHDADLALAASPLLGALALERREYLGEAVGFIVLFKYRVEAR